MRVRAGEQAIKEWMEARMWSKDESKGWGSSHQGVDGGNDASKGWGSSNQGVDGGNDASNVWGASNQGVDGGKDAE
ncbi:hypothetical protein NDU88_012002 [Pleurodeles waltl]|uniref:Uncharacterized protein n=1 Tax=Pleurodeles waltl TaxID=8319 RepID=A0AAV7S7W1_PLEWA|nr:hypothetical protein NDU88_012002 [Pleurodeles waltl]